MQAGGVGPMRVLLVEDEIDFSRMVARGLESEGFVSEVVHDGESGLWAATEREFDVIILDLMLPKLSGYEVVRRLRSRGVETPILMLTAKDGEYDQADALDLGADDYLTKPFAFVVLVARLRALLRRSGESRPSVLEVGDLRMDPAAHEVTRGTASIDLTPREFTLLEYFMRHPGEVLSKTELVEHVWDMNFDGPLNVVEVYVGYLRRKIDEAFGVRSLVTVRGFGYRLESAVSGT